MVIYLAQECECIHEGGFVTISAHLSEENAKKVIEKAEVNAVRDYRRMKMELPKYHQFRVEALTVLP